MKLREFSKKKVVKNVNRFELTGRIVSNKENVEFGDSLYALYPFNGEPLVPLVIENNTGHLVETDDGFQDTKKYNFNVNLYGNLINKVVDNDDFYIGCNVKITGFLISKNFFKTEERMDIMNLCNRYKNLTDGERPLLYTGEMLFVDKETGMSFEKNYIDWDCLLAEGLINNVPEDVDKAEYFFIEDGRVFRQERKTNYIVMAKSIENIDDTVNNHKSDKNYIEVSGTAKDIYIKEFEHYQVAHICLISNTEDMTRNSYLHVNVKGKNLDKIKNISMDDNVLVKGRVKNKVFENQIIKKKGKKEIILTQYNSFYEIDCKEIDIYKMN